MTRTALVTGSSRGIGRAVAIALAQNGFDIVLHCRSRMEELHAVRDEIVAMGRNVRCLQFDIANREQAQSVLLDDVEKHGAYYGVVCNAHQPRRFLQRAESAGDADDPHAQGRQDSGDVIGVRRDGQSRTSELQRIKSRLDRGMQSVGGGTRQTQDHRQLRRARLD